MLIVSLATMFGANQSNASEEPVRSPLSASEQSERPTTSDSLQSIFERVEKASQADIQRYQELKVRKQEQLIEAIMEARKLAKELSKRDTGKTLYILDEPTTGLHFYDIQQLLNVLHKLREHGNTIVVIEHNIDVVKTADWIIDLGPEGGTGGGNIVAEGTPEEVSAVEGSHTGKFLGEILKRKKVT